MAELVFPKIKLASSGVITFWSNFPYLSIIHPRELKGRFGVFLYHWTKSRGPNENIPFSYCWWFRNLVNSPVEVGSFPHYLQGFSTIPGGFLAGFLNVHRGRRIWTFQVSNFPFVTAWSWKSFGNNPTSRNFRKSFFFFATRILSSQGSLGMKKTIAVNLNHKKQDFRDKMPVMRGKTTISIACFICSNYVYICLPTCKIMTTPQIFWELQKATHSSKYSKYIIPNNSPISSNVIQISNRTRPWTLSTGRKVDKRNPL